LETQGSEVPDQSAGHASGYAPSSAWRRPLLGVLWVAALLLAGGSLAPWLGRLWWVLDLASHFQVQYLVAASLVTVASLLLRAWGVAMLGGGSTILSLWLVYPHYWPPPSSSVDSDTLGILCVNVYAGNRDGRRVLDVLRQREPDLFFVLEYNEHWRSTLQPLEVCYPHRKVVPSQDNFGIALYSRLPLLSAEVFYLEEGFAAIEVRVEYGRQAWTCWGVHVVPPVSAAASALRNRQFVELAARLRQRSGPRVLVGDLNCTSWSPYFRDLISESRLRDSRLGRGVQPTWPAEQALLSIPIDHALVSSEVVVCGLAVTRPYGSDHRGVWLQVAGWPDADGRTGAGGDDNGGK
jgi:endonuclease/exonuclease/phosphatase (EEP) superfamily protein YafD